MFSSYPQVSDVGDTHSLIPGTVPVVLNGFDIFVSLKGKNRNEHVSEQSNI
jgi:hypothetical protein